MQDSFGRKIEYLRVSVTDKCNLRCRYCMPQEGITRLAHDDILRLEEWARIIRIMQELGITKVRFTGGEPLVRKNLIQLIKDVHALDGISQIAMTTNGILLGEQAADLRERKSGVKALDSFFLSGISKKAFGCGTTGLEVY